MIGTYYYAALINLYPVKVFGPCKMRVEIIAETPKSYKIRYKEPHANGAAVGTETWVQRKHVKTDDGNTHAPIDKDVRLPYKDN